MRSNSTELSYQPTQLAETPESPGPEHKRLNVFLGKWKAEGQLLPDSTTPGWMRTEDAYEWLPGGFFLIDRGTLQINDEQPAPHTWVFGYDASNDVYFIQSFDSQGNYRVYRLTEQDRTWTYAGDWERATLVFGEDGTSYTVQWEQTKDGTHWHRLCDLKAIRIS